MTYKMMDGYVGYPPIEQVVPAPAALNLLPISPGEVLEGEDKVWGGGEFIFARAGGAIRAFALCVLTPVWDAVNLTYIYNATETPNVANAGRELGVNQCGAMAVGQYGWFMLSGMTPVDCTASIAADTTFGIAATGEGGAVTAGKQVLNARIVQAATLTVAKPATGDAGSASINVNNTDGWFVGAFIAGTGIAAAARITAIDPPGKVVTLSAVNTAAVTTSATVTYNNAVIFYNVARLNRPFAQGAIT